MKLDATLHRYLEPEDYRVLMGVEVGSRNHEIVPLSLISTISNIRSGGVFKLLSNLSKHGLVNKSPISTPSGDPGYVLAYGGYDYLALHTFAQREHLSAVGHRIGVGKESDIYCGQTADNRHVVIKMERLGRTSFRQIRNTRDYFGTGRKASRAASWLYLSRKAAEREWSFMNALWKRGFPVPEPLSWNRHAIIMERIIDGIVLDRIHDYSCNEGDDEDEHFQNYIPQAYEECMSLIVKLAQIGLIHSDFNEFNVMWDLKDKHVWIIDFPQMVSITHPNASELFQRDVNCIKIFFNRRFGYESEMPDPDLEKIQRTEYVDVELKASGYDKSKKNLLKGKALIDENKDKDESKSENESEDEDKSENDEQTFSPSPLE